MIIVYRWITEKHKSFGFRFNGNTYSYRTKDWTGYFLFGIIPLLIVNSNTTYTR